MLINECKPEFQFKKSSKNAKFAQCLYLVAHLCYEQNRCAERTVTPLLKCHCNEFFDPFFIGLVKSTRLPHMFSETELNLAISNQFYSAILRFFTRHFLSI